MTNRRRVRGSGKGLRRSASVHRLDDGFPVDAEGFPLLDAPGLLWEVQYHIAMTRYGLSLGIVPYASRYLAENLDLAAIVDDVVRRLYRGYEIGKRTDWPRLLRGYIHEVEAAAGGLASEAELTRAWVEHARNLRERWGDGPFEAQPEG